MSVATATATANVESCSPMGMSSRQMLYKTLPFISQGKSLLASGPTTSMTFWSIFTAFQDVCNAGQDRAILALLQLQQRMVTSAPIPTNAIPASQKVADTTRAKSIFFTTRSDDASDTIRSARSSMLTSSEYLTPPTSPHPTQTSPRPISSMSRISTESSRIARRDVDSYKPFASTVIKTGLFGIGKRTRVERIVSPPDNPLVDGYLADALESNSKRLSRSPSITTAATSIYEPDHPSYHPWRESRFPGSASLPGPTESICSFDSVPVPTNAADFFTSDPASHTSDPQELLPSEMNNFAGFCKGAWRQQMGDTKRAMEERVRPGGMYNQAKYWQCKYCTFEGRLVPTDKKKNNYDTRVFKLVKGIQFRWEFMFKTHVTNKTSNLNPTKATFGCIFCCSEGRGTPESNGIQSFMDHLREHREDLPIGEVLYRMNTLMGRQATLQEDFDLNFVSLEEGPP